MPHLGHRCSAIRLILPDSCSPTSRAFLTRRRPYRRAVPELTRSPPARCRMSSGPWRQRSRVRIESRGTQILQCPLGLCLRAKDAGHYLHRPSSFSAFLLKTVAARSMPIEAAAGAWTASSWCLVPATPRSWHAEKDVERSVAHFLLVGRCRPSPGGHLLQHGSGRAASSTRTNCRDPG